jgi:dTDP-4-dehydrorhamnose reductase
MRLAVTGTTGRLGGAVRATAAKRAGWAVVPWGRAELDLDSPGDLDQLISRDGPDVVVHCAAWTDVDGCAREPELAEQRNGRATAALAEACARHDVGLVAVSTNEVFDGRRTDRRPYRTADATSPANAYGRSKRSGELGAQAAFASRPGRLWIVRTSWLFGAPGTDFPVKILAAARSAIADGRVLSLVADEVASPTYAVDLAEAILDLLAHDASGGLHHVINGGTASRADWARRVLDIAGVDVPTQDVSIEAWPRASTPPRWGVLEPTVLPTMGRLRAWQDALAQDLHGRLDVGRAGAATA